MDSTHRSWKDRLKDFSIVFGLIALILLAAISFLSVSAFNAGTTNLRVVGNTEARQGAQAAAQAVIDQTISNTLFTTDPAAVAASPIDVDIDGDGNSDYRPVLKPPPACTRVFALKMPELDPALAADLACMGSGVSRTSGIESSDAATEAGDDVRRQAPMQVYRNKRDPFDDMEAVRTRTIRPTEMRERAHDAIEWVSRTQWVDFPDDRAEQATRAAARDSGIARHILMTGSQDYYEGFRAYVRDPEGMAARATTVGTGSLGYMLPFVLDPTIILSNDGSSNPYRRISRVEQTTSSTWNGVTSAGVNAAFGSEAGGATSSSSHDAEADAHRIVPIESGDDWLAAVAVQSAARTVAWIANPSPHTSYRVDVRDLHANGPAIVNVPSCRLVRVDLDGSAW